MKALATLALIAAGCTHGAPRPPAPETAPRLVVVVIVDQLPEWAFEAKRPALHGGFDRLLAEGSWQVGRLPYASTLTAPGHALIGTGESPLHSGIIANRWWRRDLHRLVHAVEDDRGATNAANLRVPGIADSIEAADSGAKAVGISLKDRAAILPLGHSGLAIWFDPGARTWATLGGHPEWLVAYDHEHPIAARLREVWTPLDPQRLAQLSGVADDQPGEVGEKHLGPTFPHDPATTPHPDEAIFAMPLGNEVLFDLGLAAIDGEELGRDRTPDLLVISLSAHDYVGHGWGQESWEAWDTMLRLDAQLDRFTHALDSKLGADHWAMLVTSDHGASPLPERAGGGRITQQQIRAAANAAAAEVLGAGEWVADAHFPYIYFTAPPTPEVVTHVSAALRALPGIERADSTHAFDARPCRALAPDDRAICLMFDNQRSGDVFYLPKRGWVIEDDDEPIATSHGSLHDEDRLVPVIIRRPGAARHAPAAAPSGELDMRTIAPTLAGWLGVAPPSQVVR